MTFKAFLAALTMVFMVTGCKGDKKTLTVGTSADYPPFEYFENNEIVGFEIELIKEIAKRLGYTTTVKDMSFDSIVAALQSRRIDLAISNITQSPERAQKVDFSLPYYTIQTVLVVKKDSAIKSSKDLTDKTIGAQFGTVFELMAKNNLCSKIQNLKLRSLNRIPDLLQDFKNDRIQGLIVGVTEAQTIVKANSDLKIVKLDVNQEGASIALPKDSELTEKINGVICAMQKDGSLKALMKKWKM